MSNSIPSALVPEDLDADQEERLARAYAALQERRRAAAVKIYAGEVAKALSEGRPIEPVLARLAATVSLYATEDLQDVIAAAVSLSSGMSAVADLLRMGGAGDDDLSAMHDSLGSRKDIVLSDLYRANLSISHMRDLDKATLGR